MTCPKCGQGTESLTESAWPEVIRRFGNTVEMFCQICRHRWLNSTPPKGPNVDARQTGKAS